MCELYGRDNCDMYVDLLAQQKTREEIQAYSDAFWKNYQKIDNWKKYIERIEKGEAEILKRNQIDQAIEQKWTNLITAFKEKYPSKEIKDFTFQDIEIIYEHPRDNMASSDPFDFHPDEDKFYAFGLFKYTFGYWELMRNDLRNSQYFFLNWVVHTRTVAEIQKRSEFLVNQFKFELFGPKYNTVNYESETEDTKKPKRGRKAKVTSKTKKKEKSDNSEGEQKTKKQKISENDKSS